jgi:hypothetical protein
VRRTAEVTVKTTTSKVLISSVIVLALGMSLRESRAQQTKDSSYEAISTKFFYMLQQQNSDEAIDYIFSTNPGLKKMPDKVEQLKAQFASLDKLVGRYITNAKLTETQVAGRFVYQHYFVAYERQPISIRIKYYKPGADWMCYSLQFDADLADLIQKRADEQMTFGNK